MGSRRPYVKAFEDTSMQWRNLSYPARALFALLHFSGVEPDGTVAVLKSSHEVPHRAIIRWIGVPREWRRGIAEPTAELLRHGYIYIDGDRVKLANHVERQAWRGGKIPAPFIESHDPLTGEVRDSNTTSTRQEHDVNTTSTRHQHESNGAKSHGATMRNHASPPLSSSASKEQEVTYRQDVASRGAPGGQGATGSADGTPCDGQSPSSVGAQVFDFATGEVFDMPPDEHEAVDEHEAAAAVLPVDEPTPEDLEACGDLFDDEVPFEVEDHGDIEWDEVPF